MIQQGNVAPGASGAGPSGPVAYGSERVRVAYVARAAALRVPGVIGTDSGPAGLFVTTSGEERVEGVTCVAVSTGGYEVSLRLVCRLVALHHLGDQVSTAVSRAASIAGLAADVVHVHVADVEEH